MALRILHVADVHLGAKFLLLGEKGEEQRNRLFEAVERAVEVAISENVDIFLVAGDLFDSNGVSKSSVSRVLSAFQKLTDSKIKGFIAPGTHDLYGPDSVYKRASFSELNDFYIFDSEEMKAVTLPELDCAVYGIANMKPFNNRYPLNDFHANEDSRWKIGVIHAGFEGFHDESETYLLRPESIASSNLDYLALGHYHSFSERSSGKTKAYYPGSPELLRMDEKDSGSVLLVELDDDVSVRKIDVGKTIFDRIRVQSDVFSSHDLRKILGERANLDKVLKVIIEGMRGLEYGDISGTIDEFYDRYFYISVEDHSFDSIVRLDPRDYPQTSASAAFLRVLGEDLKEETGARRDLILEAMRVGLSMLEEESR